MWQLPWEVGMGVEGWFYLSVTKNWDLMTLWGQKTMLWIHMSQGVENEIENKMKTIEELQCQWIGQEWSEKNIYWERRPNKQLTCLCLSWVAEFSSENLQIWAYIHICLELSFSVSRWLYTEKLTEHS